MAHVEMGDAIALAIIEGPFAGFRHIDELVEKHQLTRLVVRIQ